jgi:hypothetical protein
MSPDIRVTPSVNRRACRRAPLRASIRVECRKGTLGLGPDLTAVALDISDTGAHLILKASLPRGQDVEVLLLGGHGRPLKRAGRIIWSFPTDDGRCCVGIRFDAYVPFANLQTFTRPHQVIG